MSSRTKTRNGSKQRTTESVARQQRIAAIDIFESAIVLSRFTGRAVERRLIGVADIIRLFGEINEKVVHWMPLTAGVAAVGTDADGRQRWLVTRAAKRTRILCEIGRRKYKMNVQMPNLLAELVAEPTASGPRWIAIDHVWAFGGRVSDLNPKTQLRIPPLPNMHHDGSVCMGEVDIKRCKQLPAAEAFKKAFIESTFTDHILDTPLIQAAKKKHRWRNIFDALRKTKGRIPLLALRPVKKYGEVFK